MPSAGVAVGPARPGTIVGYHPRSRKHNVGRVAMHRENPGHIALGLLVTVLLLGSCGRGGGGGDGGTPETALFAVVNVDGTLRRGTAGTTSAQVAGGFTGDYTVTF